MNRAELLKRLHMFEGQEFYTHKHLQFTYRIRSDKYIEINRTTFKVSVSIGDLENASSYSYILSVKELKKYGFGIQTSYIYGIITDSRFKGGR